MVEVVSATYCIGVGSGESHSIVVDDLVKVAVEVSGGEG